MRLEIRDFRIPIILTALMIGVITYWTWQSWHWLDDHEIDKVTCRLKNLLNTQSFLLWRWCCSFVQMRQPGKW